MKNTIRNYKNTISINFAESGDNFTLDVPHYPKWLAIIRFLKKRGFTVKENWLYKEQYKCLSQYHKIGYKNDVALLMEIKRNGITVEFGNIKNLWERPQSFWSDKSDQRYTKLLYLEEKAVELEIKKLMQFCEKWKHEFIPEKHNLSPEQEIISQNKENKHIHGEVNCLEDIKNSIKEDSYNYIHNSNDANGKKIISGERKYFYDYFNKRLSTGIVWHNINNMWWVISNNKLYNIARFYLFDFDQNLPKRKPANKYYIERILKKYEEKKDYIRCHKINLVLDKTA